MERSLIKEVNNKNMAARVNTSKVLPMVYPNFFGVKKRDTLKWETLSGEKGIPVMADVVSYDATAPIKTREIVNKMSGDIPKILIKRGMNETDWNTYQNLARDARSDQDMKDLLDVIFADFDFCLNGVRARMEYIALQVASKGELVLSKTNNGAGIVTEKVIDFGVPVANKTGVTTSWATIASSKPLDDIENFVETIFTNTGRVVKYAVMGPTDFKYLKQSADTIAKVKSYINSKGNFAVTKATINAYNADNDLPQIVVVKTSTRNESKTNTRTILKPWEDGRILLCEELKIGDIQHGPIAAENSPEIQKIANMTKTDYVLMTKWGTHEPFTEWTKGEANAFPVLNDPDGLFYIRTDNKTWD